MKPTLYVVDAFTNQPFRGNPAAVCYSASPLPESLMKNLALEMNLSETAFVSPLENVPCAAPGYTLRWFTPAVEVDLCGHATLSAAHVMWATGRAHVENPIRFSTRSGWLTCRRPASGWIELDFPALPIRIVIDDLAEVARQVGFDVSWAGDNGTDLLVEVASPTVLYNLQPDLASIGKLPYRGLIVTTGPSPTEDPSPTVDPTSSPTDVTGDYDFLSRFFAPAVGIAEDPVTGSAHCTLGPYWQAKTGASELVGKQISPRGGLVKVNVQGDRVLLSGQAVLVSEVRWLIDC